MSIKMFDLVNAHREALELWVNDGDTPEECWADTLQSLELSIEDKARAYAAIILELEAEADAKKTAARRIAVSAKTLETRADFLRDKLKESMEIVGLNKFKFAEFNVTIPKPRASLSIENNDLIPACFKTEQVVTHIDNAGIKQSLMDGNDVLGAKLEYKTSIRIA